MKRIHIYAVLNVVVATALALLTVGTIHQTHHAGSAGINGWLIFSPVGTLTGLLPLVWLLGLFMVDALWVLFCIISLVKRILHIKDKDKTLYLP